MAGDLTEDKKDMTNEENVPVIQEVRGFAKAGKESSNERWFDFKQDLLWHNIIAITVFHFIMVYAWLTFWIPGHIGLTLWGSALAIISGLGVTAGAHRLWTHRTYKAKLPLRIILMICFLLAGMNSIRSWVRDHRVHHKYTESDADPHNSRRGFFFSHVGWLMMKKHPEVLRRGKLVDMSDVVSDPVVQFQEKYFIPLKIIICFIIPVLIPVYMWNEEWYPTMISQWFMRYGFVLNTTWSVNSFAHIWGYRRYDKMIAPSENKYVAYVSLGEGWHNYHHVFPWDYKTAELGSYTQNFTTLVIDFFAKIGWAYDCRTASDDLIKSVIKSRGDGSHPIWGEHEIDESNTVADEDATNNQRTKNH